MNVSPFAAATVAPAVVVAGVGAVVSYIHISDLALRTHQGWIPAHLLPLSLDGLIVAGSAILLSGSLLGWLGVVPGVVASLFSNVMAMLPHGGLSAAIASWPALSFIIAAYMVERRLGSVVSVPRPAPVSVPDPLPVQSAPALNGSGWSRPQERSWS